MNVADALKSYGDRIDAQLEQLIPRDEDGRLRDGRLSTQVWHHMDTGGKRIRPALCMLTCEALGGSIGDAMPFAVGVELLHNMLLLHDDIEDGDEMRRDRPTVWKRFGVPNAVNAGDYLLGRALTAVMQTPVDAALRVRLTEEFIDAYERTVEGQALDINSRANPTWTVDDYLRMVVLKTGRYLTLGMIGGALIAGADERTVEAIYGMGETLGPAFQIRDDLIDLTEGKGRGGVIGSDVREGKPSILYAHALGEADLGERETLLAVMAKPREETGARDVAAVMTIYEAHGSIDFAQRRAEALIDRAYATIDQLPLGSKDLFRGVADFMAKRKA